MVAAGKEAPGKVMLECHALNGCVEGALKVHWEVDNCDAQISAYWHCGLFLL